jgi:hypothetical protein
MVLLWTATFFSEDQFFVRYIIIACICTTKQAFSMLKEAETERVSIAIRDVTC